jgi:hypothetical protein
VLVNINGFLWLFCSVQACQEFGKCFSSLFLTTMINDVLAKLFFGSIIFANPGKNKRNGKLSLSHFHWMYMHNNGHSIAAS